MAKILLISPHRTLRQAVTQNLFPDHEVQAASDIGEKDFESLDGYDLLIIDETMDGNNRRPAPELALIVEKCKYPILLLEEGEGFGPIKKENRLGIKNPLHPDSLHKALNELLLGKGHAVEQESFSKGAKVEISKGKKSVEKKSKRGGKTGKREPKPIDLVDVVEEES